MVQRRDVRPAGERGFEGEALAAHGAPVHRTWRVIGGRRSASARHPPITSYKLQITNRSAGKARIGAWGGSDTTVKNPVGKPSRDQASSAAASS